MTSKQKFISFYESKNDLPLFSNPKWLNAVCNNWGVAIYEQNNSITAFWVYVMQNKKGFKLCYNPPLTPYLGIWIEHKHVDEIKNSTQLGNEKEVFQALEQQLPHFDDFNQNFTVEFKNWYPLFLKNYKQTTRYTYAINQPFNLEEIFADLKRNWKRAIKQSSNELIITESNKISDLITLKNAAKKEGTSFPIFSTNIYNSVFNLCESDNIGKLLVAENPEKSIAGALLLVWDNQYVHIIHGATHPKFKKTNAMSLLIWEALKIADSKKLAFNFEGSMVEAVEHYFRLFNAEQTPYFNISKTNSKILKFKNFIKSL